MASDESAGGAVPDARDLLARFLSGHGVELGPGHHPFHLPFPGATVRYVDRWDPVENRSLFPELGSDAEFTEPDISADLDVDGLAVLDDASQDFVIASHVLEHMADPLALLVEMHRVLAPGGVALILLPDRTRSFDADRRPTDLEHLAEEHRVGVKVVSDEHLEEFLRATDPGYGTWDPEERARQFEFHRRRSIHVHCWSQREFLPVLEYSITDLGLHWELLDAAFTEDAANLIEFGFALRRPTVLHDPGMECERLRLIWSSLYSASSDRRERLARVTAGRDAAEAALARVRALPGYSAARKILSSVRRT